MKSISAKAIGKYIFLILGILITINAVSVTFLANGNLGLTFTYILGVFFLLCGIFFYKITAKVPKWIQFLFLTAILALAALMIFLFVYGSYDNVTYEEDTVIVLGAGIRGEEVGVSLKGRLDKAIEYYSKNPDAVIIVSGGQGPSEDIAESLAMERYLTERGVPKENIRQEDKSTSTNENLEFSKVISDAEFGENYSVVLITNDYHIYRAEIMAENNGYTDTVHYHSDTEWYMVLPSILRECSAVLKLWVFG